MDPNTPSPNKKTAPAPRTELTLRLARVGINCVSEGRPIVTIYEGQLALENERRCRATGKTVDDGTPGFMEKGIVRRLELIGGPIDGLVIDYNDPGNHWGELEC